MFANMTYEDRQAFFELMNLWADSRPDLFKGGGGSGGGSNGAASIAASHAQSFAAKNPAMTSNLISSGIQHQAAANPQSKWSSALQNDKVSSALGRVGAAGLASGAAKPAGGSGAAPPPPPSASSKNKGAISGLVSSKSFGHVDTSTKFGALKTVFKDPQAPAPPYVPPPRTGPSPTSGSTPSSRMGVPPPPVRRVSPAIVEPEPEQEEEQGNFAEAVYEFASDDPGDLPLKAKQVVEILEKVSADWWRARDRSTGKEGLVPSAYVKEL